MSKDRKSASVKTQQHIQETAYINSVLSPNANTEVSVSKTTIELVKNVTKWPEEDILRVLKDSGNDPQLAINKILDGSAGKPTQWTEVERKRAPKAETKPAKQSKPANGVQNRDGGGKTYKNEEKREDRNQEKKREARKRPPKNAPGTNQEQTQQTSQPQAEVKQKEPEVQTTQASAAQNVTTSAPSQTKPAKSSKENGSTSKQSVTGWGKPPASIYTDSNQPHPQPAFNPVSQPTSQTSVVVETTPVVNPPTSDKPKQDNLPRWGPQSKPLQTQPAQSSHQAPPTTSQNANASPASPPPQVQSSESQLAEVQPVQTSQSANQTSQASKSPSTARPGYHPPSMKAWKPKDAKVNDQPQTVQAPQPQQAPSQQTQALPQSQVSVTTPQTQQNNPQVQSQTTKTTPTTTPTNKTNPAPYAPVAATERSAVILPPSSVALIGGNTPDVHFGVFGSTFTETSTQARTESSRVQNTQYQPSHVEVSHAHAHPHTDRLGVEHLHIAEAYSPDHQAPQMEDPHSNQIPPYFLHPSYVPTFAPQFTYETDPSIRAMHVYDPNQVQGYQPHNLGYHQGIPDSKYENSYSENKYGAPESTNAAQNPQTTQAQGPQTQPQHPAYYSSPMYPYPYPPNQYSFQNPSVTPSQYLPRFYQRPFPANYPGNSTYLQPGAPTGVQPVGATHAYPGTEDQDAYKPPVQFSVPMSSYFMPPEANPSMLGKPTQNAAPKGQSQVNYNQGNPSSQTEQTQPFKTNQTYQPGNNPRESYYNMQQPQYGQVQGQSNYTFVPPVQTQVQPQAQSQPFPRNQYQ